MIKHNPHPRGRGLLKWRQFRYLKLRDGIQSGPDIRLPPCRKRFHFLNSGVLDIKLIRDKTDFVRSRLATRGAGDEAKIDELLKLDEQRRKALAEVEALKSQRNRASK